MRHDYCFVAELPGLEEFKKLRCRTNKEGADARKGPSSG